MSVATIKLVNAELLGSFFFAEDQESLARKLLAEGYYKVQSVLEFSDLDGEAVAEEVFDLTNNPSRDNDRDTFYGRFRSVSVGDIVEVDGDNWLCKSVGWKKL